MAPTDLQDRITTRIALTFPNHLLYAQTVLKEFVCNASSPVTCRLYITKRDTENCTNMYVLTN